MQVKPAATFQSKLVSSRHHHKIRNKWSLYCNITAVTGHTAQPLDHKVWHNHAERLE